MASLALPWIALVSVQFPPQKGTSRSKDSWLARLVILVKGVVLMLQRTSSDDEHWASKIVLDWSGTESEQLAICDGLTSHCSHFQHLGVKVLGAKEVDLDANRGIWGDIAEGILLGEHWVFLDRHKVASQCEIRQVIANLTESSENNGLGDVGVHGAQGVGDDGTKRMTDMDGLFEFGGNAA